MLQLCSFLQKSDVEQSCQVEEEMLTGLTSV